MMMMIMMMMAMVMVVVVVVVTVTVTVTVMIMVVVLQAAICRCSQPLSGFSARCVEDESLLQAIRKANTASKYMFVVDMRPKASVTLSCCLSCQPSTDDNIIFPFSRTTTQVNGKVGNLTPAPSETPEPIVT